MSTYLIGDIHGCFEEFQGLLKAIDLNEEDDLYVLGDAVDRGPEPMKVLLDLMNRPNVTYILGNHDFCMYSILKRLAVEITDENYETHLTEDDLLSYQLWLQDGGEVTARQFATLPREKQLDVLDYLSEASLYEELEVNGKRYVLAHTLTADFNEDKPLEVYELVAFLEGRADYSKVYFADQDTYLVTGHTPTPLIHADRKPFVYEANNHIAIDCGCVFGGQLAAYCLENGEVTYVKSK